MLFLLFSFYAQEGQIHVALNEMSNLIVVCDPADRLIKSFNYTGDLVHRFEPSGVDDGLACIPAGIHILLNGDICVCDSLNHTVSSNYCYKAATAALM